MATSNSLTYTVTISPSITDGQAPQAGTTYTITSIGKSGSSTKKVVITVTTPNGTSSGSGVVWQPPTDSRYVNTTKFAVLSNGDLVAYNDNSVVNGTYGSNYQLGTTAGSISFQWGLPVTKSVSNVLLDLLDSSFFSSSNPRFAKFTRLTMNSTMNPDMVWGSSWGNLWSNSQVVFPTGLSMYEVSGDVVINTPLSTGTSDRVLIYSHGNITVNKNLQGNFVFVADGTITLNGGSHTGQIELYSNNNMILNSPVIGYGVFMSRGNLTVNGSNYVKAFMYGRNAVVLDGGGVISGDVYSNGPITISGGVKLTYDATAIPQ